MDSGDRLPMPDDDPEDAIKPPRFGLFEYLKLRGKEIEAAKARKAEALVRRAGFRLAKTTTPEQ